MIRAQLKSKIHRVAVTQCELNFKGSCAIDKDPLISSAFTQVREDSVATPQPQLVFVNEKNQQVELRHQVPTQLAP
jgi:aspartate 1-decarboxylase